MKYHQKLRLSSAILNKATALGASLVGICSIKDLANAPSFKFAPKLPAPDIGGTESNLGLKPGEVFWPEEAKSAVVIAYAHPEIEARLDWWLNDTNAPGNRILIKINRQLSDWIEENFTVKSIPLNYFVEKGGIFLKDAAVYAGLGCIGRNNILVTPEYGPRVRLRAMLLSEELPSTGPRNFFPCSDCMAPCLEACPRSAFDKIIYNAKEAGQDELPGLNGNYDRVRCNSQMLEDIDNAKAEIVPAEGQKPVRVIKYCRRCELSCPVGKP